MSKTKEKKITTFDDIVAYLGISKQCVEKSRSFEMQVAETHRVTQKPYAKLLKSLIVRI